MKPRRPARTSAGLLAVTAAGLLALAGPGCAPETPEPPAIVLVTLDTMRADRLGCGGDPETRTPHLDRFARRGLQWAEAVSPIPLTTPSHASILSGLHPRSHGLLRNRMRLAGDVRTVPEILREAGFRTGAVVSSRLVLGPEFGLDRGFDSYQVMDPPRIPATGQGERTLALATDWLRETGGAGSFLWTHFFDAHLPYLPPAPLDALYDPGYDGPFHRTVDPVQRAFQAGEATERDARHLRALYAGEVTFLDRCAGRLIREARGVKDDTIVIVTADHGEGLHEHDRYFGHDIFLYDTALRVPLLVNAGGIEWPGAGPARGHPAPGRNRTAPGQVRADAATTLDLAPTLLALAGIEPDASLPGRDLLGEAPSDRILFVETYPDPAKANPLFGARVPETKCVWDPVSGRRTWWDLATDPAERTPINEPPGNAGDTLATSLIADLAQRPPGVARTVDDDSGGLSADVRAGLESLGYVDGD